MATPRKTRTLTPIATLDPRYTVMTPKPGQPVFVDGPGDIDWLCPSCGFVIGEKLEEGQVRRVVVQCAKCGKYSAFPD